MKKTILAVAVATSVFATGAMASQQLANSRTAQLMGAEQITLNSAKLIKAGTVGEFSSIANFDGSKLKYGNSNNRADVNRFAFNVGLNYQFDENWTGMAVLTYGVQNYNVNPQGSGHVRSVATTFAGMYRQDGYYGIASFTNSYNQNKFRNGTDYQLDSAGFGGTLTGGYVYDLTEKLSLDSSGTYAIQRLRHDSDKNVYSKAVTTQLLQVQEKAMYKTSDALTTYVTAGVQYQFSAKSKAEINNIEYRSNVSGTTGSLGLGVDITPFDLPLTINSAVTGYVGEIQGAQYTLNAIYSF